MSLQEKNTWSQPVIFKADKLIPVLEEAIKNKCHVLLVQCYGLFFMSEKGNTRPDGRWINVAYAEGFNPDEDYLTNYKHRLREICGGSDFSDAVSVNHPVLREVVEKRIDIQVRFTEKKFLIEPC